MPRYYVTQHVTINTVVEAPSQMAAQRWGQLVTLDGAVEIEDVCVRPERLNSISPDVHIDEYGNELK